uniref:RNA binding protein, putative n=1 Tax=Arundo donax TaxID=35708 RepID=A0A0A9H8Z3_ARUDO
MHTQGEEEMDNPHQALEQLVQQSMRDSSDLRNSYLVLAMPHSLIGLDA